MIIELDDLIDVMNAMTTAHAEFCELNELIADFNELEN